MKRLTSLVYALLLICSSNYASAPQAVKEECEICWDKKTSEDFTFLPCTHRYCISCLSKWIDAAPEQNCCPECRKRITSDFISLIKSYNAAIVAPARPHAIADAAPAQHRVRRNRCTRDECAGCAWACGIITSTIVAALCATAPKNGTQYNPQDFIQNYHPHFMNLNTGEKMANRYCPNFLQAGPEEQKMIDTAPACMTLTGIALHSNELHMTMLKKLAEAFPDKPTYYRHGHENIYHNAVTSSYNQHIYNLEQVALAKELCGCVEDKKTK